MVKYQTESLDAVFSALADPTRRALIERLAHGEASVTALAAPFDVSLPAVTKHLRVLEHAGLVTGRKEGRVRRLRLVAGPMREAADWIAVYREFWDARFDALAAHLRRPRDER